MIKRSHGILSGIFIICSVVFSQQLNKIEIIISPDSIALLEAAPYSDRDVHGSVVINDTGRFDDVQLHYRGAYALYTLIDDGAKQRNWKIKFNKDKPFRKRREWNFTFERHLREKMAYDLLASAGVAVPSAEHAVLYVNGDRHGLYLMYEDPDDKSWLRDAFGDNSGDLFKAAYDMPDEPSSFALLTDLGDGSADYFIHYNKKTNNDSLDSLDYRSLMRFIKLINHTPGESFPDTLRKYFETGPFLKFLAISNFILNWDSYPTRPKNYWLYHNPSSQRWHFIPWDMDATFQEKTSGLITVRTDLGVFSQLDKYEPYKGQPNEGTERPLVRRMMEHDEFKTGYIREYAAAMKTYLGASVIVARIDSLAAVIRKNASGDELKYFNASVDAMKTFLESRYVHVQRQLDSLAALRSLPPRPFPENSDRKIMHASQRGSLLTFSFGARRPGRAVITLSDAMGRVVKTVYDGRVPGDGRLLTCTTASPAAGLYCIIMKAGGGAWTRKIIVER